MGKHGRSRALDHINRAHFCALVALGYRYQEAAATVGCAPITARREAARNRQFKEQWRDAEASVLATRIEVLETMLSRIGGCRPVTITEKSFRRAFRPTFRK